MATKIAMVAPRRFLADRAAIVTYAITKVYSDPLLVGWSSSRQLDWLTRALVSRGYCPEVFQQATANQLTYFTRRNRCRPKLSPNRSARVFEVLASFVANPVPLLMKLAFSLCAFLAVLAVCQSPGQLRVWLSSKFQREGIPLLRDASLPLPCRSTSSDSTAPGYRSSRGPAD